MNEDNKEEIKPESPPQSATTQFVSSVTTVADDIEGINAEVKKLSKRAFKKLKKQEKRMQEKLQKNDPGAYEEIIMKKKSKLEEAIDRKKLMDLITKETLDETEYYFENSLRKVYPYYYSFTAHAKGRWYNRKLVDVFVNEFQSYSYDKCKFFIERKSLRVENKEINMDYVIQNGDIIVNRVHRHELPVTDQRIDLIANTDELLVVDKPASIPIHPCGRYRHNSLLYILAKEYGFRNLRVLYRIDRLTSGLVIFGKTEGKTQEIMGQIRNRLMNKVYLCKVDGEFPSETIECNKPIEVLCEKLGIYTIGEGGKESHTTFKRLSTDGQTSIVRCEPKTGRTHQIRIHLQYLGYPIINDPTYNDNVWGPVKGKDANFGKSREQLIADLMERHKSPLNIDAINNDDIINDINKNYNDSNGRNNNNNVNDINEDSDAVPACKKQKLENIDDNFNEKILRNNNKEIDNNFNDNANENQTTIGDNTIMDDGDNNDNNKLLTDKDPYYDETCTECSVTYTDPKPEQLYICLHALSYQGPDWSYTTQLPHWADNVNVDSHE